MKKFLARFYRPCYMVKDSLVLGEIPTTLEGYSTAFATAWAAIAETFLVALIGMADTIMVSGEGTAAIAAVGLATQPRYFVQTIIFALNIAMTAICARRRGEGDREGAISTLKQGLILSSLISVILVIMFFPLSDYMVHFMGSEPDTHLLSRNYLAILLLGLPMSNISLTISSAQRGIGQTKASMVINLTANVVNVIFNYLLINGIGFFPKLGVEGAAIATVIGYGAGLLVAISTIVSRETYLFVAEKEGWKFHKVTLQSIFKVASGSFVEQVFLRIGFMSYVKIIAGLGSLMMAAHQILMNIVNLSFCFGEGYGIAASTLVGQNIGAKRSDLSIVYGKICQRMAQMTSALLFIVFITCGDWMVRAFSSDATILDVSSQIFPIMGLIIFGQAGQMVFMGALRGAGDTRYTAIVSMISIMFLRPIAGYLLAYPLGWGLVGAWLGMIFDQYVRLFFTYIRFSSGKWRKIGI